MNVNRKQFLDLLNRASIGVTPRDVLEQSGSFVFDHGQVVTYNEDICFRAKVEIPDSFAIPAADLIKLLGKFDEDEIEVSVKGDQFRIRGSGKSAGLTCFREVTLPFSDVPRGKNWTKIIGGVFEIMVHAAKTCGRDYTRPQTTTVNVSPNLIQGFDNHRLLRATVKTGFPSEVCIPATAIISMARMEIVLVDVSKGWTHFRSSNGDEISVHCICDKYIEGLEKIIDVKEAVRVRLPSNMADSIERAKVMLEDDYDSRLRVEIEEGKIVLRAQKGAGWYKESRKASYEGPPLAFDVHPDVLVDIVALARQVKVAPDRMKIEKGDICYVIALMKPVENGEE